jgi:lipid II:glycine glycyltransferase (peptidoglycan interpeptide bridge formation enzyme)
LEVPSLPAILQPNAFAEELRRFVVANGVTELYLNTYASPPLTLPPIGGEVQRFNRTEFVIDLSDAPLLGGMSRDHRQRIKRALRAGLKLRRTADEASCLQHAELISATMARREQRGESVSTLVPIEPLAAILKAGAGELFQLLDGGRVVSSMLLLRSRLAAYDHTSGSTAEGMATGASRLVIFLACEELQREGCQILNLGGVRDHETGLRTFKERFGARQVQLQAISAEFTTPVRRLARRAVQFLREVASN